MCFSIWKPPVKKRYEFIKLMKKKKNERKETTPDQSIFERNWLIQIKFNLMWLKCRLIILVTFFAFNVFVCVSIISVFILLIKVISNWWFKMMKSTKNNSIVFACSRHFYHVHIALSICLSPSRIHIQYTLYLYRCKTN